MKTHQLVDVTLRDGLMYRPHVARSVKKELLERLMACGVHTFEVVRFPLDGKYPQFNDAPELLADLQCLRDNGARIAAFAMGFDGVEEATRYHELFDELHVPCFVSDSYARYAFGDWTWDTSLRFIESTLARGREVGVEVTVGLGTSFGCPIRRAHDVVNTIERVADLVALGVNTVMLGDTAGTATPMLVKETFRALSIRKKPEVIRTHFHNTFGKALLNSYAALIAGANGIDTSLLGLGGEPHPYFLEPAMVDNGNCATEELFEFLEPVGGAESGDRSEMFAMVRWFASQLGCEVSRRSAFAELVPCESDAMTGRG